MGDKKRGDSYDFAIGEDVAKMKPWNLIKKGDTFPIDGGIIRAFILPYGIAFRIEKDAPKESKDK